MRKIPATLARGTAAALAAVLTATLASHVVAQPLPAGSAPAGSAPTAAPPTATPAAATPLDAGTAPVAPTVSYEQRPEVLEFINAMVQKHHFERADLIATFALARYSASTARLISPPGSAPPLVWSEYRARFLDPVRIDAGIHFWQDHRADLARAQDVYGVPAEVIVGILGVETLYGRNTGKTRVIDALSTLSFDYPNKAHDRSAYFRGELEQLLLLARANQIDLTQLRGSYAGAIGMPQFMPDSYQHYAVDFDGDGRIDLLNGVDAIGSVAHYLAERGWQRSAPIVLRVQMVASQADATAIARLVNAGAEPSLSDADLVAAGFVAIDALGPNQRVALVDLPNGDEGTRYVLGAHNFYVLTRYNRSYAYAMAVLELGETIQAGVLAADSPQPGNTPVDK